MPNFKLNKVKFYYLNLVYCVKYNINYNKFNEYQSKSYKVINNYSNEKYHFSWV